MHCISFPSAYFGRVVATAHDTNYCEPLTVPTPWEIGRFKQQRTPRLRKRHLKSEFALLQTLSRLFHLVKCWQISLELSSKGLYQSSGKEKENCCLVFPSSTNVMHVQSCRFGNIHLLLFCRSRWRHDRRCLSSLKTTTPGTTFSALQGGVPGLIFAGYVPLASQSLYSIIVYFVANYRPYLSHFSATT